MAPYRIYNIGNEQPVELLRYIEVLEQCLGRKAVMEMLPLQAGDVPDTEADVSALALAVGYTPKVPVETGIANFVHWYRRLLRRPLTRPAHSAVRDRPHQPEEQ